MYLNASLGYGTYRFYLDSAVDGRTARIISPSWPGGSLSTRWPGLTVAERCGISKSPAPPHSMLDRARSELQHFFLITGQLIEAGLSQNPDPARQ